MPDYSVTCKLCHILSLQESIFAMVPTRPFHVLSALSASHRGYGKNNTMELPGGIHAVELCRQMWSPLEACAVALQLVEEKWQPELAADDLWA